MNTEKVGGGIPPDPVFFVTGVAPIIMLLIGGGPPVGGIPGIPEGGRPIPAGVLRLGTRRPAGAMSAARGSEGSAAGVAGAGVEGVVIDIVGGGGGARAFASSAGSSTPSWYQTLNSLEYTIFPEFSKKAGVASGFNFFVIKLRRDQPDFELGVSDALSAGFSRTTGSDLGGLLAAPAIIPDDASDRGPAGAVFGAGVKAIGIGGSDAGPAGSLVGTGKPPAG